MDDNWEFKDDPLITNEPLAEELCFFPPRGKMLSSGLVDVTLNKEKTRGHLDIRLKSMPKHLPQIFTYKVESWLTTLTEFSLWTIPWRPWFVIMFITVILMLINDKYEISILGIETGLMDRSVNTTVHGTFGITLGFLIVHISTQACQRWWKARVAWEDIITNSRDAMRIMCCHCNGKEILKLFAKYLIAFSITSKHYLRKRQYSPENALNELERVLPDADLNRVWNLSIRYRPLACLYACQRITELSIKMNLFTRPVARDINPRLISLANSLGVCECILFTPIPWVYSVHLRFVMVAFLLITPLAMFSEEPLPSKSQLLIFMAIISYSFLTLEDLASKVQTPFGNNLNHLPLDLFMHMTYKDVKDVLALKYEAFGKAYSDRLYELGKYEIEWVKKTNCFRDDDEEGDD